MQGRAASSIKAYKPSGFLAGPSGVLTKIIVIAVVLVVKERMKKICSAAAFIAIGKDATSKTVVSPAIGAHIYSPPKDTTILQA